MLINKRQQSSTLGAAPQITALYWAYRVHDIRVHEAYQNRTCGKRELELAIAELAIALQLSSGRARPKNAGAS
jgi:hypothetical protein